VRPAALTAAVSSAGGSSFLPQNIHHQALSPLPAAGKEPARSESLPVVVSSPYLPVSAPAAAHSDHYLAHIPHGGDGGHGPLAVPPPPQPPTFLLDPKVPSPYGSVYGSSMASLNTSLDCQPADLSIGSTGEENLFIRSDIVTVNSGNFVRFSI
jgi:hypothetical protein